MSPNFFLSYKKQHPRLTNHYGLALFTFVGCVVAKVTGGPDQPLFETISLATGYAALLLVLLTLVIGPINMLKKRKNPVNMMFRRDAGIWAGITAILHIVSSFTLYFGGNLLLYFFQQSDTGLGFSFDLFYLSDYVGLIAGLVILFLLVLSNNYFLKMFKGPKWKQFQRFNYLLFGVAFLHTLGQQLTNNRNLVLTFGVIALSAFVVIAQSIGVVVYRRRDQQRKAASSTATAAPSNRGVPKNVTTSGGAVNPALSSGGGLPLQPAYAFAQTDKGVGRRRFLLVAGTVMLSGVVGGLSAKVIAKSSEPSLTTASNSTGEITTAASQKTAVSSTAAATGATATTTASAPNTTSAAVTANTTSGSGVTPATGTTNATAAATTASASTAATTTTAATTAAAKTTAATTTAAPTGTVLATIATLAAGKAIAFTTPDTKAAAFVVHRQDGSVTCLSGICTHEPVKLTFDASSQTLYCPKHGVPFDTQTGAPQRGPARTALAKYKVTVDSQGQIIYG